MNPFSYRKRRPARQARAVALLAGLLAAQASGQQVTLALSSGSGAPGSTVTLSLTMTASGGAQPTGLQWSMGYSAADITGVAETIGAAAAAAGKTLTCNYGSGTATCLIVGFNATTIGNGTVATLAFTIAPGTSATSLPVTMSAVSATNAAAQSVPASGTGGVITVNQPPPPVAVSNLSCTPGSVNTPGTSTCTVALNRAAEAGGFLVTVSDGHANVTVPSSVTVPSGSASAQFTATASQVATDQSAVITATGGGASRTFTLNLLVPAQLSSLMCTPATLGSGQVSTCTAALDRPAGSPVTVALSSSTGLLTVPASVTINAGSTSNTFSATAGSVASNQSATVTASYSGQNRTATVNLVAATALSGLACAPASVNAPGTATCTVTLSSEAPPGGFVVTLSSGSGSVTVPGSVTVASGSASAQFAAAVGPVAADQAALISASAGGSTQSFTLTLLAPAQLAGLSCTPATLGSGQSSTCTVTLTKAAAGAATVTLASSTGLLSVPASVTISSGAASGTFSAVAGTIAGDGTATVTASYGGQGRSATVNLVAATALSGLACAPVIVPSPGTSTCTVTLAGAAPAGGFAVALSSTNAGAAVPGGVTVTAGSSTAQFTVTVALIPADQTAVITASAGGVTRTFSMNLLGQGQVAAQLGGLSCAPVILGGGQSAACTVTLTQARAATTLVTLSASLAQLSVPSSVTISAGSTSAQFQATAGHVSSLTDVVLTAAVSSSSAQQTLSILPVDAPIITSPLHVGTSVMLPVRFGIAASDPQGLPVALTVSNVPSGAGYSAATGQFSWTPTQSGTYTLTAVARNSEGASTTRTITIKVLSETASVTMVRNAADLGSSTFCSPGSWATLLGVAFTTLPASVAGTVPLPTCLAGVEVRVGDTAAPLLYVSETQINFQCPRPPEAGESMTVSVKAETGVTTRPLPAVMNEAAPGLFGFRPPGRGENDLPQGSVLIAGTPLLAMPVTDGYPARPARRGEFLSIYANGLGQTEIDIQAGSPAPLDRLVRLRYPARVFLGELDLTPDFAGLAAGAIGLYQINVRVPAEAPSGPAVPLRVQIQRSDGTVLMSNHVTVAIE